MSAETHSAPSLGEAGETCRECGYPLATDQRYCLNCGRRRGEPRVDFRRHPLAEAAAGANGAAHPAEPAASSPAPVRQQGLQRDYAPLAAVGGIAVLGLMLLVGVLIGKGDSGSSTPPPQVVRLGEESAGSAASEEGGKAQNAAAKGRSGKGSAKTAKTAEGGKGTGNAVVAGDQELQELQEQSPEEYQESSAKLPDEIATGGAPPPEDNKAPGGGSKGTAIE